MIWYKALVAQTMPGMTIGKWLVQARSGPVDPYSLMQDVHMEISDSTMLERALQEAHQYLVQSTGQTENYNTYQTAIVDAVRNMTSNPMGDALENTGEL
jgi:hypothetical protein